MRCDFGAKAGDLVPYWLTTGRKALAGSSLPEANAHLAKALDFTSGIGDQARRAEHELEVRTALGAATMALYGWPAPQVRTVIEPACDIFERGHGGSEAFMNLWNLWVHHGCRAEHAEGLAVVDRMFKYASSRDDPVLRLVSSFSAAMAHLWIGDYGQAAKHEADALAIYEIDRDRDLVWHYNHDPKSTLLIWASHRVWALGYPDKARALSDEAVAHARKVGHPFNLCWNLCWTLGNSSIPYANCGEFGKASARIDELRRVAREQKLAFMEAYMAPACAAVIAVQQGEDALAFEEGTRAEEIWRSIGGRFWGPVVKASMARACLHLDRPEQAVDLASQAIQEIDKSGEFMFAEEIHRIAGLACLHQAADRQGAEVHFERSLDYARKHGTRSFELRTSMCLSRLLRDQGKQRQASLVLRPVFEAFTEGFETADLKEAKELLCEL